MKYVVSFIFFVLATRLFVSAQADSSRIQYCISQLSWNSIAMDCQGGMLVLTHENKFEQELINIGKPASQQLIAALRDKEKTVISHIILSQIWDAEGFRSYMSTKYIYSQCHHLVGWHNIYNGLVWEWYKDRDQVIERAEIDKIFTYWTSRITNNPTESFNDSKIIEDLILWDELKFPCNKVYDNNSAAVQYKDLEDLLHKNLKDAGFKKLWSLFGNDSTIAAFKDCFYINYGAEGLSFRFNKNGMLTTIFVEEGYEGELPDGIQLTDKQPEVEQKIGKPTTTNTYADNTTNDYKKLGLNIDYNKNGEIIKFAISKK